MKLTRIAAKVMDVVYSDVSEEALLAKVLPMLEKVGMDDFTMGFLGEDGEFYDGLVALEIAKESKQIKDGIDLNRTEWLSPLDLKDFPA